MLMRNELTTICLCLWVVAEHYNNIKDILTIFVLRKRRNCFERFVLHRLLFLMLEYSKVNNVQDEMMKRELGKHISKITDESI